MKCIMKVTGSFVITVTIETHAFSLSLSQTSSLSHSFILYIPFGKDWRLFLRFMTPTCN